MIFVYYDVDYDDSGLAELSTESAAVAWLQEKLKHYPDGSFRVIRGEELAIETIEVATKVRLRKKPESS